MSVPQADPNTQPPSSSPLSSGAHAIQPPFVRRSVDNPTVVDTYPARASIPRVHGGDDPPWNYGYHEHYHHAHGNGRPQSPSLPWHKPASQLDLKQGRVLVIDFQKATSADKNRRKVIAQELFCVEDLRKLYKTSNRTDEANKSLRLFHVQNAPWATRFLLKKFNIQDKDDVVGTDFGHYARYKRPERRGGKPFLTGRTWRVTHDPWRKIAKTSFGLDYLKPYRVHDQSGRGRGRTRQEFDAQNLKMMEFNCYDRDENPTYGYDVFIQRLSCYVQHKERSPPSPSKVVDSPYHDGYVDPQKAEEDHKYRPKLDTLDNENAIIIFENSHSGLITDTLIAAREEWEKHWRRLPFYLAYESTNVKESEDLLGVQCAKMILDDVFKGVVYNWDNFMEIAQTHVSILEDKIYDQPADETRAPELWGNSSQWLKVEKLMFTHMDVVKEMRIRLRELTDDIPDETGERDSDFWLEEIPNDFERLTTIVQEDLIKPTQALISLLYQSVSIRDSRHSLQLGTSMWRLSWITFIFLPLTFMVGFFGMNVDTFSTDPSIKWYFIVAIPFMFCVLAGWFIMKHILARQRQTPYQRGIYENFFHDLAVENPSLWSRAGPRDGIIPASRLDKLKWSLIRLWSRPEKTIRATVDQDENGYGATDDLGEWAKLKRYLTRKWTRQIHTLQRRPVSSDGNLTDLEEGGSASVEDLGIVADGVLGATELLTVPAANVVEESAAPGHLRFVRASLPGHTIQQQQKQQRSASTGSVSSVMRAGGATSLVAAARKSSSEGRNSAVMVEEEDPTWLTELGKQGKGWWWSARDRSRSKSPKIRAGSRGRGSPRSPRIGTGGGVRSPSRPASGSRPGSGVGAAGLGVRFEGQEGEEGRPRSA
ncbi:MAG: hypothetical protein Q9227_006811 [Pyrenula ochraceoflavens]